MLDFPQPQLAALQDRAARLLDSRKAGTDLRPLARDLLVVLFDVCMHAGLDRLLDELAHAFPPLDASDRNGLSDHDEAFAAVLARLGTIDLDGGGPRDAKPRQLVDSVVAGLGLNVVDEPDRSLSVGDDVRGEVVAAVTNVIDTELAVPKVREDIIAEARARCEERFQPALSKVAAQLDDRGLQLLKQPKVPIDAMQAVQQALFDARNAVVERAVRAAIDRAQAVLERAAPEAAARIDLPVTLRVTPREVAILRACDPRSSKSAMIVRASVVDSLTQLVPIRWRSPERPVHPYSAKMTFAVGDLIDHPKFGRGAVVSCLASRIDVEFPDGKHTLVHVPPRR